MGVLPLCCTEARANGGVFLAAEQTKICRQCPVNINHGVRNSICIQLAHGEVTFGYLMVLAAEEIAIDPEEQSLLLDMAEDVAFALHNMAQEKAMERVRKERDAMQAELHQAQKMDAIGRLAGGVAHDFNNILTAIIGFSQIILNKLSPQSPLRHFAEMILASAEKAAGLTHSLLAFSRKQPIKSKPTDLNLIIEKISKLLARVIGEDIHQQVDLDVDSLVAMVDGGQIEQVLMNLATNARDAMPEGGTFSISTERLYLDAEFMGLCGWAEPGDYICIGVSDTGCGIPREVREEMFEPFFTTKEAGKGTGLGLSIVH
jgi:signal transduction histidine kinase